jgi:hypothetical protein
MHDRELFGALFSPGDELWRAYHRKGNLHLLLKAGHEGRGLRLYRPHRFLPTLAMKGVELLAACGLHCCSKSHRLSVPRDSAIPVIEKVSDDEVIAVMFGNPTQSHRRVIALTQSESVFKIGFSRQAREVIKHERRLLESVVGTPHCPEVRQSVGQESFEAFSLPWLDPWEGGNVEEILNRWTTGRVRKLEDFPEWPEVLKYCPNLCGERKVAIALEHGDFAPWNLRRHANGDVVAIDWETGLAGGMAGRDLVHYHLQVLTLLKGTGLKAAVGELAGRLKSCRLIGQWGWSVEDLLLVSFATSWVIPDSEKDEVIGWLS